MNQLTNKSFKAGFWLSSYRFSSKLLGLFKTAIVARILTPQQFGLFGVVSIALNLFETFSETGTEQALIHKKQISNQDISTAWFVSLARSLVISAVLYISAPLFASFFELPSAKEFIQIISITPILRSLRNPQIILLKKQLNFKLESIMLFSGSLTEVAIGIIATIHLQNVWGLVISIIAGGAAELIASYIVIRPARLAKPNIQIAKKLLSYGRWVWASSALSYLVNQGDDIVVGKILGASPLGLYQNAYKIASVPATQIAGTVTQVAFPAFSSIQEDNHRLKRAFKKSLIFTVAVTTPISLVIIVFAHPITNILLGDQWLQLVPALRVLGIYGIIRAIAAILAPLANAIGKPQLITINGIIRTAVLFAIITPLSLRYGILGASWATVIAISVSNLYLAIKLKSVFR